MTIPSGRPLTSWMPTAVYRERILTRLGETLMILVPRRRGSRRSSSLPTR